MLRSCIRHVHRVTRALRLCLMKVTPRFLTPSGEGTGLTCTQTLQHATVLLGQPIDSWIILRHVIKEGLEENLEVAREIELCRGMRRGSAEVDPDQHCIGRGRRGRSARQACGCGAHARCRCRHAHDVGKTRIAVHNASCMQSRQGTAHLQPQQLGSLLPRRDTPTGSNMAAALIHLRLGLYTEYNSEHERGKCRRTFGLSVVSMRRVVSSTSRRSAAMCSPLFSPSTTFSANSREATAAPADLASSPRVGLSTRNTRPVAPCPRKALVGARVTPK